MLKKSDRSGTYLFEKEKARKAFQPYIFIAMTDVNICLFVYSDGIIVVLTPDKNIRKIEDNFLNAINAVLAPSGDQA